MRIRYWQIPFAFLLFCLFVISRFGQGADFDVNKSSNALGTSSLSIIQDSDPGDTLGSLIIGQRGTAPETIKIYDSSGTANNLIATIDLSTSSSASASYVNVFNEYVFNLRISSAITISKSAATSNITILWKNVR